MAFAGGFGGVPCFFSIAAIYAVNIAAYKSISRTRPARSSGHPVVRGAVNFQEREDTDTAAAGLSVGAQPVS